MAFTYKRSITFDYTKVDTSNQTNFPALVSFTNNDFKTVGNGGHVQNSNGYDICFYSDSSGTTALKWEMEKYVATTGEVIAWVKIPTLSASVDTVIWVFYGDSGISSFQSTATDVWDSNYKGVWHLPNNSGLSGEDSTSNNIDMSFTSTNTIGAKIGDGADYDGTNSKSNANATSILSATLQCWMKFDNAPASGDNGATLLGLYDVTDDNAGQWSGILYLGSSAKCGAYIYDGATQKIASTTTLSTGTWYYLVTTWVSGSHINLYVNGTEENSTTLGTIFTSWSFGPYYVSSWKTVTNAEGFTKRYDGILDELRVSNTNRSANWIKTEYNNQNSPSTFFTLGSEQSIASNIKIYNLLLKGI